MKKKFLLSLNFICLLYCLIITSCSTGNKDSNEIKANNLFLTWNVLENNYNNKYCTRSEFILVNKNSKALANKGWDIFFNFGRRILKDSVNSVTCNVDIKQINGDFFVMSPKEGFLLNPGDSVRIQFSSADWIVNYSDAPAGVYIVFKDDEGNEIRKEILANYIVAPFKTQSLSKRAPEDLMQIPTLESIYEENKVLSVIPVENLPPFVPIPVEYSGGTNITNISAEFCVSSKNDKLKNKVKELSDFLSSMLEQPLSDISKGKVILLTLGDISYKGKLFTKGSEAYQLTVKYDEIEIKGADEAGVFYGIQSLKALIPAEAYGRKNKSIPVKEIKITDYPRYSYRGLHLDVARNFQRKEAVLNLLDLMSSYKLNKFHFHLTDDEGWRIEIKALPELTEVGAKRWHDRTGKGMVPSFGSGPFPDAETSYGSGYYTQQDFVEILNYAKARHIEVIPEIDLPGHSRAAIKSMKARYERFIKNNNIEEAEKYLLQELNDSSEYQSVQMWNDNVVCVCNESLYNFMETVINELKQMYEKAGLVLENIHIGGDEVPDGVWEKSPSCIKLLEKLGKEDAKEKLMNYFLKRADQLFKKHKIRISGWEEIALKKIKTHSGTRHEANREFITSAFRPYVWNNVWGWGSEDNAYKLANSGYQVILSNATDLYFDLAYSKDPSEPGYYWAGFINAKQPFAFIPDDYFKSATYDRMGKKLNPNDFKNKVRLTEAGKKNILGIQCQLWGENNKGQSTMEYLLLPRLISFAQRAWSPEPAWAKIENDAVRQNMLNSDWNIFANMIGQIEYPRLEATRKDINYRLPSLGAKIENGKLMANCEFPGMKIYYTTDGTEPTIKSNLFTEPIKVEGPVKIRIIAGKKVGKSFLLKP
ncbi:MAG: carbohydate-binding domain-containing protein [Cytophagaceae bacterium]|nr:carbohydate-binding domain-containing protein [Cytophagaceae bacterium]MDW8457336.1 family 20 glycosylhydrolase [Cytophagaceae bacterium]